MKFPKRNTFSSRKYINLNYDKKYYSQQPEFFMKPKGLWYSCHESWYDWIIDEGMDKWLKKYIHKINLKRGSLTNIGNPNRDKILVIKNMKDLNIFNKKYGRYEDGWFTIDWKKVSKDYGGIEICPYPKRIYDEEYEWIRSFDVASGCIWNLKPIIKDTELIYEKINSRYIKV